MNIKRVLIVDDNISVLKSLSMMLSAHGYHPMVAKDGGEAACVVARECPDLIMLDINFPPDVGHGGGVAWDGFLIRNWLRQMEHARDVPIVVITGADDATLVAKAQAAGAAALLHKPIHSTELLAAVRYALGEEVAEEQAVNY